MAITSSNKIWETIQTHLTKGKWVTLKEIYGLIAEKIKLTKEDLEPSTANTNDPRWHQHVRNTLQYRKSTFEIFWGQDGRYMLPLSHDEVVLASTVPLKGGLTKDEHIKILTQSLKIQNEAKILVFEYEFRHLINVGQKELAEKVREISGENIGAGYHIVSYDDNGEKKYIQVKASMGDSPVFEITAHEINISKKLASQYWLYFVTDLYGKPKIVEIQNPAEKIGTSIIIQPSAYIAQLLIR
jgi:hypothetical protein